VRFIGFFTSQIFCFSPIFHEISKLVPLAFGRFLVSTLCNSFYVSLTLQ
jgi:hypothetical protein